MPNRVLKNRSAKPVPSARRQCCCQNVLLATVLKHSQTAWLSMETVDTPRAVHAQPPAAIIASAAGVCWLGRLLCCSGCWCFWWVLVAYHHKAKQMISRCLNTRIGSRTNEPEETTYPAIPALGITDNPASCWVQQRTGQRSLAKATNKVDNRFEILISL